MKNRRLVITRKGGPETLAFVEDEAPAPGPGEVRVRVLASGVAYGDVVKRVVGVPGSPRMPYTPGYDFVGEIDALGTGVLGFRAGDRVAAFIRNGAHAQYTLAKARNLVILPPNVDTLEAAALILNYVTAHQMLHRLTRVKRGERVLVHGAAGGVGTALLQLGRLAGLDVYGTASSGKHATVRELGAMPIDYKKEDFVRVVREATRGEGIDCVFDAIGGSHLRRSWKVLRRGGRLVCYGVSGALDRKSKVELVTTFLNLGELKTRGLFSRREAMFYGITESRPHSTFETVRDDLAILLDRLKRGEVRPLIGAKFPFAQAVEAHRMMEASPVSGKIVLVAD